MILLRGGGETLEVLLVKRNPAQRFMGGAWVFPGGAVDADEGEGDARTGWPASARSPRRRASRSPTRRAGVFLALDHAAPRCAIRFDTHFFLAARARRTPSRAPTAASRVDLGWFTPQGALEAHARDEILLVFPTIKTLRAARRRSRSADELLEWARRPRRSSPSSRAWWSRARPPASCCRASRATDVTLTVAVTGPTGDIGRALLRALDRDPAVERVLGMARRPFDPPSWG